MKTVIELDEYEIWAITDAIDRTQDEYFKSIQFWNKHTEDPNQEHNLKYYKERKEALSKLSRKLEDAQKMDWKDAINLNHEIHGMPDAFDRKTGKILKDGE